ncbi:universal stress protein [Nannocystis sp. ILAH1]|uniref:universal stress protein n=1 Tax=unclassified Nannocystis TaxID=2627009 RepID=UPI00226D4F5E|nr:MULTISPECIES: universal stress protein [unclassified Nannocystis]MCY0988755.1 universal stress protein [Nannocystis sp. ILAH1]MCY1072531.1 universal stress protein [Nannocystis sp. RBIL2]
MSTARQWVLGLDLGARSRGALVFARWLREAGEPVTSVHVLETWIRGYLRSDNYERLQTVLARATAEIGLGSPGDIQLVEADRAEVGLARAAEGAAALIIGRAAPSEGNALLRLGPTARRVLRGLPAPVIVVPPDLTAVAPGPVLIATDLEETSAGAVEFAQQFAARHRRPLELVHVGAALYNDFIDTLEPRWLAAREIFRADTLDSVREWAVERGLTGTPHVVYGEPAQQIADLARAREAALVVVGSRRLGTVARAFLSSTASALASCAACPVAVVPSR